MTSSRPRDGQAIANVVTDTGEAIGNHVFLRYLEDLDNDIAELQANAGNTVIVIELNDFPAPNLSEVITLEVNKVYIIAGNINIGENTIFFQFNSVIEGFGTLVSSITTSSTSALLSGLVNARLVTLFAVQPVSVVSQNLQLKSIDLAGVTSNGILIQDSPEVIIDDLVTIDGATSINFSGASNGFIKITSGELRNFTSVGIDLTTSTINLLFIDGVIFNSANGFGISGLASSANIAIAAIVEGCAFIGGLTPLFGITNEDIKWDFQRNIGIDNSTLVGAMELVTNTDTTTLITNTPVQLTGNFVLSPPNERFILTSFELEALVAGDGLASISMDGGASAGGSAENYDIVLLQNGTPDTVFRAVSVDTSAGSIGLEVPVSWVAGDTFSIAVTRRSGVRNWITRNGTLFIR